MSLVHDEGGVVVLRGGGEKALVGVLFGLMILVFLAVAATSGPVWVHVVGSLLVVALGALWIRWLRAEVRAEQEFLILRTPFRTHSIPWSAVTRAEVVPTNNNRLFAVVRVTLNSGKQIKVDGAGRRWSKDHNDTSDVGQMVEEINSRVLS